MTPVSHKNKKAVPVWKNAFQKSHFAPAFFSLSPRRRRALETLYSVCRILDDAVDVPFEEPAIFLEAWKDVFQTKDSGKVAMFGCETLARDFLNAAEEFDIDLKVMEELIDRGVACDLKPGRFQTPMDTEEYCYGVASTVGIACLPIFGVPDAEGRNYAIRLGIAIQWVNTIRDVQADLKENRFYLPQEGLAELGLEEKDFSSPLKKEQINVFLKREADRAKNHFLRAQELMPLRWKKELLPARIMGRIYQNLLEKITRNDFPVMGKKVKLGLIGKVQSVIQEIRN